MPEGYRMRRHEQNSSVLLISLAAAFVAGSLAGCARIPQSVTPMSPQASYSSQTEKSYRLGEPQKAYIGAPMIRVQQYSIKSLSVIRPVLETSFEMAPWGIGVSGFQAAAGLPYTITNRITLDGEVFYVIPIQKMGIMISPGAALVRPDGSIYEHPMVLGAIAPDKYSINPPTAKFSFVQSDGTKERTAMAGDQNFELIFSGIANGAIRVLYREYTGDNMARPAFTQELSYERAAGQIRFRNFLLKIANVSNEEIDFVVVSE